MNTVVELNEIRVSYFLPKGLTTRKSQGTISSSLGPIARIFLHELVVLDQVSLSIPCGSRIGVVGVNGTGKSTLLKLLAGALSCSSGSLKVDGTIASVLSLGGGLIDSLSGEKNAVLKYYNASSPKFSLDEFIERLNLSASLGEYMKMPVSTYSAGMKARLNRGMLELIDGDVFLFDEWVVLGDSVATSNSNQKNRNMLEHAKLVMLASHSESLLREWTDQILWLHGGGIQEFGPIDSVLPSYQKFVRELRR